MKEIETYLHSLETERRAVLEKLRSVIKKNLPKGFAEVINYGMIGYVVPHSIYPAGYHCKPSDPLPFLNIAAQKNFFALYHMGLYADEKLLNWFTTNYQKQNSAKLDVGKSCIRFKKADLIPFKLIGELVAKISPKQWIELYEKTFRKSK